MSNVKAGYEWAHGTRIYTDNVITGRTYVCEPSPGYAENVMAALRRQADALCWLLPRCYGPYRQVRRWRGRVFVYRTATIPPHK